VKQSGEEEDTFCCVRENKRVKEISKMADINNTNLPSFGSNFHCLLGSDNFVSHLTRLLR
jgi:hypothetical protein